MARRVRSLSALGSVMCQVVLEGPRHEAPPYPDAGPSLAVIVLKTLNSSY